jgi:hypothetical protein
MLSELTDLQDSEEYVWGTPSMSFTIRTREDGSDAVIQREYTFSYAEEWEKWTFTEFEEKRGEKTQINGGRHWRRTEHKTSSEEPIPDIDVPPEVGRKLNEAIGSEEVTIQMPRGSVGETTYKEVEKYD